jgi:integrase
MSNVPYQVYPRPDSKFLWYKFTFNGKLVQKSTKTTNQKEADKIAAAAWTQHARGEVGIADKPKVPRKTISDLLDGLIAHLKFNRIVKRTQYNWIELVRKDLGSKDADLLSRQDIIEYVTRLRAPRKVGNTRYPQRGKRRLGSGCLTDDTIRNRLSVVKAAYKVENEYRAGERPPLPLLTCPSFPQLAKKKQRTNLIERADFDVFYSSLPDYLRDYALFMFLVGWRRNAVANLKWDEDVTGKLDDGTAVIHLRVHNSKNKFEYSVPVAGELVELMKRREEARVVVDDLHGPGSYHFPHMVGKMSPYIFHRAGSRLRYVEDAWQRSANKAGCPALSRHDLRRSARCSFRRAGVHDDVMRAIMGWEKPGSDMASQYDPVSPEDKAEALETLFAFHKKEQQKVAAFPQRNSA